MDGRQLARGLGWFSVGLGLYELLAPRRTFSRLGLRGQDRLVRGFGLREISAGLGILLAGRTRPGWLWTRVAGDLMDFVLLESARPLGRNQRRRLAAAKAAVVGATVVDVLCAERLSRESGGRAREASLRSTDTALASRGGDIERVVIITQPGTVAESLR
jgi:hypothetical protein